MNSFHPLRMRREHCSILLRFSRSVFRPLSYSVSQEGQQLSTIEQARSLFESRISCTLSTLSSPKEAGLAPIMGSLMPFVRHNSRPIFGLNPTEQHYQNIQREPFASMVVFSLTPPYVSPAKVPLPRLNITSSLCEMELEEVAKVKRIFQDIHPGSQPYLDEYRFYTMDKVKTISLHSGYKNQKLISPEEFFATPPDPISPHAREIMDHFNSGFKEALRLICREYGELMPGIAFIYHVDRFGFNMAGKVEEGEQTGWVDFRLPFPFPLTQSQEVMDALMENVEEAMKRGTAK